MPWIDAEFSADADSNGEFHHVDRVTAPVAGRILRYKVKTLSGCKNRTHNASLTISRVSDPNDTIEIKIDVEDCKEVERLISPPFRVRSGEVYEVKLSVNNFDGNEHVEGSGGVFYTLFFDLAKHN